MRRIGFLVLAVLLVPGLATAQDAHEAARDAGPLATAQGLPDGWLMRLDRESFTPDMIDFQTMEPGWHVKSGRAAGVFWRNDATLDGTFEVSVTYHLFNPASHAEAFGLFIGGSRLGEDTQEYAYFLVRQTGEYLIKLRTGSETSNVVGWTANPAIPVAPEGETGPTQYDLAIVVGADEVSFVVNDETVHSLPSSDLDTDGVYGLRINHMLDLHVEALSGEPTQ